MKERYTPTEEIANGLTHGVGLGASLAGGIIYTVGTIFYHNRRVPYSHAIWHLFVICGSVFHYLAISNYVLLPGA